MSLVPTGFAPPAEPHGEYSRRRDMRAAAVAIAERRDDRLANARLVVFVAAAGIAVGAWGFGALSIGWLGAPAALFVVLVVLHERCARALTRARAAVAYYDAGLRRLEQRWHDDGERGVALVAEDHPYAADLDLFGERSLFQLLCRARTPAGAQTLARWLARPQQHDARLDEAPALRERVATRRAAVRALQDRLDFRETLALAARALRADPGASGEGVDPERLSRWGEAPQVADPRVALLLVLPTVATVLTLSLLVAGVWPAWPLLVALGADGLAYRLLAGKLARSSATVVAASGQLALVAQLAGTIADALRDEPDSARLAALVRMLGRRADAAHGDHLGAAAAIAALERRVVWLESMKNPMFAPVGLALLGPLHAGLAIERWRARYGHDIARWLAAVGELEALASLATYAYEHPDDVDAELLDSPRAEIRGEALRHPLLPGCVPNDVALGDAPRSEADVDVADDAADAARAVIISGSNMSGKSTYLRTIGVNVVLALAGAPVHAARLSLSPLSLGATLRIEDSLSHGRSRFYAELARLRQLVTIASESLASQTGASESLASASDTTPPLLFLLDEVLAGTNSSDRRAGAALLLDALLARGAIGLVTTHDLAIAEAAEPDARLRNQHFDDTLVEGDDGAPLPSFDYTLREGIVSGSNALALMRAVGIGDAEAAKPSGAGRPAKSTAVPS